MKAVRSQATTALKVHVKMSEIRENNRIYPNLSMQLGRNFPGDDADF